MAAETVRFIDQANDPGGLDRFNEQNLTFALEVVFMWAGHQTQAFWKDFLILTIRTILA